MFYEMSSLLFASSPLPSMLSVDAVCLSRKLPGLPPLMPELKKLSGFGIGLGIF